LVPGLNVSDDILPGQMNIMNVFKNVIFSQTLPKRFKRQSYTIALSRNLVRLRALSPVWWPGGRTVPP